MAKLKKRSHEAFCEAYVAYLNGAKAAISAGYSQKTARVKASQLLTIVNIQRRIDELFAEKRKRLQIDTDQVLTDLAAVAFLDPGDVMSWDDNGIYLRPMVEISDAARLAVAKIVINKNSKQVTFHDKPRALDAIAKHLGLYRSRMWK